MAETSLDTLPDTDNWHPHTEPPAEREFDVEKLQARATHLVAVLHGRASNAARYPKSEALERMQALKEELDLAILVLGDTQPVEEERGVEGNKKYLVGLEKLLRWIWQDGAGDPFTASIRVGVVARFVTPGLMGNGQQVDLLPLFGMKFKQEINREFIAFRREFNFFDQLMRSEAGRENMRLSYAERRARWTEKDLNLEKEAS